jgi:mycoredoxin
MVLAGRYQNDTDLLVGRMAASANALQHPMVVAFRRFHERSTGARMAEIIVYSTGWCCDCRRAKQFLRERKIPFREVNIDESPDAEELVLRANNGRRKVPTLEIDGRFFAASPFDPYLLAEALKISLNPK